MAATPLSSEIGGCAGGGGDLHLLNLASLVPRGGLLSPFKRCAKSESALHAPTLDAAYTPSIEPLSMQQLLSNQQLADASHLASETNRVCSRASPCSILYKVTSAHC